MRVLVAVALATLLAGCSTHLAVFVPPGVPVRLAEPIHGARVFVRTEAGMEEATADLYPGMWIVVDPAEWPDAERAKAMNLRRSTGQ